MWWLTARSKIALHQKLIFLGLVVCLAAWGLLVLYEASYFHSLRLYKVGYFNFLKQVVFVVLGFLIFALVQKIELKKYLRWPYLWIALAAILPLVPNIDCYQIGGTCRWIVFSLPGPDHVVIHTGLWSLILFFIGVLILNASNRSWTKMEKTVTVCAACWIAVMLIKQPDTSMFILLFTISLYYLFINGRKKTALALGAFFLCIIVYYFFLGPQYIQSRLINIFDYSLSDPTNRSYQMLQSRFAFYHGKWFGVGVGNTISSLLNLPEAHCGFIFSVLGEAHGLFGVAIYITAIIAFFWFGMRAIARINHQLEANVLTFFVYFVIVFAFTSIAVTIHILPIFDSPLPFFSYGGAFTLITLFTSGWIYKNLDGEGGGMKIKIFDFKKPLSLIILVVAAILFIRAVHVSYAYHPAYDDYLAKPNEIINYFVK